MSDEHQHEERIARYQSLTTRLREVGEEIAANEREEKLAKENIAKLLAEAGVKSPEEAQAKYDELAAQMDQLLDEAEAVVDEYDRSGEQIEEPV